ncbi:MAG: hypothetical protein Q7J16_13400 [Candidatus Cloacimonadales bacterium]|nr:hypothetical protein [Candidatus Cloacimonadales bacterium]
MAEFSFTFAEIIDVLVANEILPKQISNLVVDGKTMTFKFKLKVPFPTTVDVSLEFLEFEKGLLIFKIKTAWLVEKALKNPAVFKNKYIELDKSNIIVYLDMYIKDHLRGLQLDKIEFLNNKINVEIYTIN